MLMNEKTIEIHQDGRPDFRHEAGLWLMFGRVMQRLWCVLMD